MIIVFKYFICIKRHPTISYSPIFYTCSQCDFTGSESLTLHSYVGEVEKEPQMRSVWCYECKTIRRGVLPYLKIHTTQKREEAIDSISYLKLRVFYNFSKQKKKEIREQQNIIIEEENIMQTRVNYFKNLPFKSKCISCGSHKIKMLKPFTTYMDHYFSISMSDVPPEPTGITHTCGGEILASIQARFNFGRNYTQPTIEYNEQGNIIPKNTL